MDWCGGGQEKLDPAVQYAEIARAIERAERLTGHKMYFSICEWGQNSPWTWAPHIGGINADIWRTSGDIAAPIVASGPHAGRKVSFTHMISNFEKGVHPEAEHTGFYNDPDMLVAGMPGMSEEQDRVHMALWAVSGAPLMIGADLTKLNHATLKILTNPRMVAIDQDPLGLQGVEVAKSGSGLEVWSKRLAAPGARAVVLLNPTNSAGRIAVRWSDLGLAPSSPVRVTDVWTRQPLAASPKEYATVVPANDAVFLLVQGRDARMRRFPPLRSSKDAAPGVLVTRDAPAEFAGVASPHRWAAIAITYANRAAAPRYARLHVNGTAGTWIEFPPTGNQAGNKVWIQARLGSRPHGSIVEFSSGCEPGPRIRFLDVQ